MHLIPVVLAMAASATAVTAPFGASQNPLAQNKCANATSQFAGKPVVFHGDPGKPQKLTELPDAETYAAVYRLVNGCAVPVLYREVRRPKP